MRWWLVAMLVAVAAGKGKKQRHHKPGRAVLDRLSGTTLSEVSVTSGAGNGLLPAPLDVAPYSVVTANATCGERGSEEFCRDTPGKRGIVCDVCEGSEGPASRRHPAALATDGDPATWWQSPTLNTGEEYAHVELIATLPEKMELLHIIIKSGPSPRPLAWSLEVSPSETGDDWRMVRAFGDREHCRSLWDLRPERRRRKARAPRTSRADKTTCSTQFASPRPLENGEMHVGMGEGVPARRVRISFRAAHAASHQYYTVRELTVAARCICHGHAKHCTVDHKGAKCDCTHGTCGAHCQRCCGGGHWTPHRDCEESRCACAERGACAYDDTGAMLCVNCTDNRAGPLCDRCLAGYYNALPDGPCLPCDCDPEGSDGSCEWDRKQHRILCTCNRGFAGSLCESCEDPTAVFPNCLVPDTTPACKCDPRGIVDPSRVCDDVCECKMNVVGERCDTCAAGYFGLSAAGYFGLSAALSAGCRACYCSHVATRCHAGSQPARDMVLPLGEAWLISDPAGKNTVEPSLDEQGKPYIISYEVEGWDSYYWVTTSFSGQQLAAYGGEVRANIFWAVARGDSGGNPTALPDVILIAADGTRLTYGNVSYENPGQLELAVPLLEDGWRAEGELISRTRLMDVLLDVRALLLRAYYHNDQDEVRLEGVEVRGSDGSLREVCSCPAGYDGPQCARCAFTHVRLQRAPASRPPFECVPCACNGHASCSSVDGPCGECQHNTTGLHCDRCLPGHYGNPVLGPCKPCACPLFLATNNFSPNCALASAEGDDYVCTQCPDGYTGDHCESCDSGYWGSPITPGGSCVPCECGGGPCHALTGRCLLCPPHTEGERCDQCQEGYWAGGANGSCVACACGAGALSAACDTRSGACACAQGWAARACDVCAHAHGGIANGCPACRCGAAATSATCDAASGACSCAAGAAPPYCDTCLDLHHGFSSLGCLGCNCSTLGSEGNACDIRTGQCRCRPHVTGRACDTCEEGYWGLERGGCRRCECGAGAAACDPVTGLCACAAGVGGPRCDHCLSGFYGFGPTGCLPCPQCTDGKVCSPTSGRCVCPGRTRGPGCSQCARGYWAASDGCQRCGCGAAALSDICESSTGQCQCRTGWTGRACDRCAPGHFGPRCRPCDCSPAGTKRCGNTLCACDEYGRCPCKDNVEGDKCDVCLKGTFGLSDDNPTGCTACFCFGRSAQCTQADVVRAALHAPTPTHLTLLRGDSITTMDQDSLLAVHTHSPDATISVPWPPVPVYAELGDLFLGDRVMSYGGALRFRVEEEGGEALPGDTMLRFPLVRLYGENLVLDYYERIPPINGSHAVFLHESLWEVRGRGAVASRGALMLVLEDLQRVLLRVSTRMPTREPLHVLLLNVSMETAVSGVTRGAPAPGVERCACPRQYDAASCHKPAPGFWLPPAPPRLHHIAGTIIISLDAEAKPCECNGRATSCDPDTGHCLNCTENTSGPRCERCAEGHYGSPAAGGCRACPCPSRALNHASSCALTGGHLLCYCRPGYTGTACEQCALGYVRTATGACAECACDARGAVTSRCDARATCRCRPFATGERCERCLAPRHYLEGDGCKPCDNCTQTLLDSVEALTADLNSRADLTELSRIPQPFPAVRQFAHNASTLRTSLEHAKKDVEHSRNMERNIHELEEREHHLFTTANKLKMDASRRDKDAIYLSLESMSGLEEVLKQRRLVAEQVTLLDDFAQGERHLSAHRALKEARHLLKTIRDIRLGDFAAGATDVSDSANLQSTSVKEYEYRIADAYKRTRKLQSRLERWETRADDLPRLADIVWTAGDVVTELRRRVVPKLASVRDVGLRCRLVLEDIINLSSNNFTEETREAILHTQNLAVGFPALLAQLNKLAVATEEKEGILYSLTPAYKHKYLDAVEKHVAMLGEKAKEYKSLFAGTRAVASAGVQAARAWGEVAAGVREASRAADAATAAAATAAKLARGPQPLIQTAHAEKLLSDQLRKRGADVLARAEELRRQLESARRATDVVSVALRALGWRERALASGAETSGASAGSAAVGVLNAAGAQADRVFAMARALYDEAAELRRRVRYQLRRKLATLQRLGDTALGAAEEHVSQIRGNTLRGAEVSEALGAAAAARARDHAAAAAALDPRLAALRDSLQRARHAAATISVSVQSGGAGAGAGCSRAFAARGAPSVTRLGLALSFDAPVRDGTLLFLQDQESDRYMRLSVANSRLRLSWNVGGGEGLITHPEPLQPVHDDADHTSYRIEIERIWGTVRLQVELAGKAAVSSTNSTDGGGGTLRAALWWLGEAGAPLPACVHALTSDDRALGLWSFATQPPEAQCTGCTQRWYGGRETLVWFDGEGYAQLLRSGPRAADRRRFSLSFTFRTRDRDALLFYAEDPVNNRSVSVVMRSCRVVFAVQYGGSRLEIVTGGRHCDGQPAHVQATRLFHGLERGSLRVNGQETLGSPTPPVQAAAQLPELSGSYWLGGAPPGHVGHAPPLLGCIGALLVDREGYNLLDTPTRSGVEPGCGPRTLRSAILEGSGYIELPSPAIRRKAALGLTFRAEGPAAGLLLYRAPSALAFAVADNEVDDDDDADDKHYLAIALLAGELEVVAAAGKGELRLRFNGTKFDDHRLHTIRLVRAHKQLEVWADEKRLGGGGLLGGGLPARNRRLYLGGVPPDAPSSPYPALREMTAHHFAGTITDLIVDSTLIGMESALNWSGARLGRALGAGAPPPPAPPALHAPADSAARCTKTSSYTVEAGAVKFGDVANSYATLKIGRGAASKADLVVSLQLRTFALDGIILLVPGSKAKPKHYVALIAREGRLRLIVRGRKRRELALEGFIADGTWRTITLRMSRTRVTASSGGAAVRARAPPHPRAARLYVGGVPPAPNPPLPAAIVRVGGFRGCVRRVVAGGRAADLVRDHRGVGQCFPNVERGAYFAGDAYAMWSRKWWSEDAQSVELKLQFRTAAATGVLLAAGDLLLELKDGVLVLSRGGRGGSAVEWGRGGARGLCDGAWHAVEVRAPALALALDGAPHSRARPPDLLPPAAPDPLQALPLYVGGLPEGVSEGVDARENFKGCIRDVTVAGHTRDWSNMEALHNVLLDSCPIPQ